MMTGRLHPYLPELSLRDYNIYLRYMRGVAYQTYLDYGMVTYGVLPNKGGVLVCVNEGCPGGEGGLLLEAHLDTLGAMVAEQVTVLARRRMEVAA